MARTTRMTPRDLLAFRLVSDARVSPDGSRVLFTRKHIGEQNEYISNLWLAEVDGGDSTARAFTSGDRDSTGRWSPDGSRVAFVSGRDRPRQQVYLIDAGGGEATPLTRFPEGTIRGFAWSPDGRRLAVAFRATDAERTEQADSQREATGGSTPPWVIETLWYREDGDGYFGDARFQLYVVDVEQGRHRRVFGRDATGGFDFGWSPDSSELVVAANVHRDAVLKPWRMDLFRVDIATGRARRIPGLPQGHKASVRWSPDGSWIAWAGRIGQETWGCDNTRLFVCRPDGGEVVDLTGHTDYCLSAVTLSDSAEASFDSTLEFSPDSRRIWLNFGWHGETQVASIAVRGGEVVFHTSGRQGLSLGNLSRDGRRLGLTVADETRLPEAAVGELASGPRTGPVSVRRLSDLNGPLLASKELSVPEAHWLPTAEGRRVQCWVMKPPGFRAGRRYPAVLEIHGGPHCLYGTVFFHEFQVLAAAGYVVVYSNPRGSKGYGEDHCAVIRGAWGQADWEDIEAVTRFMQQLPFVRTAKMGIMGGSYGGYMTNWAIGHTDVFAGAITDRCVSNLVSMAGSSDYPLVPGAYWPGDPWEDNEVIWSQSPIRYVKNVTTPTLVIHSEGDLRCNVEQGEQMFAALKVQGVPTRFVRYPRETSHGMSRKGPPDLRLHRLTEILGWWEKWLKRGRSGR